MIAIFSMMLGAFFGIYLCMQLLQRIQDFSSMLNFVLDKIKQIEDLETKLFLIKELEGVVDNYNKNLFSFKELRLENFFSEEFCSMIESQVRLNREHLD